MPKYIDADLFVQIKREWYCYQCQMRKGMKRGKVQFVYEIGGAPCRACDIGDIISDIENSPAADVEPVVRCRDCKKYEKVEYYPDGYKMCCRLLRAEMPDNGYCSFGERKEASHA